MATIDLGKIKLDWKGTYNNSTAYTVDDVVEYTDSGITSAVPFATKFQLACGVPLLEGALPGEFATHIYVDVMPESVNSTTSSTV